MSLQEREVHRYYQPWLSAHASPQSVASHVDNIAQLSLDSNGYHPRSSHDKALTALAQLVLLQLNVKKAMISLIDGRDQMILTEATRTLSLSANDELWLGSAGIARSRPL